eukprot:9312096-Pyramimonas_sp.AAC.1
MESSTEGSSYDARVPGGPISPHASHVPWPHREPYRRPHWRCLHAGRLHFGTPLARLVPY